MPSLGARLLREWIQKRGYNQVEGAKALGIHEAYMSMLLSGRRAPGRDNAVKIHELTGIPVSAWSSSRRDKSAEAAVASVANERPDKA